MAKNTKKKDTVPPQNEKRLITLDKLSEMMLDSAKEVDKLRTRAFCYYSGHEDLYLMQLSRDLKELLREEFGVTEEG